MTSKTLKWLVPLLGFVATIQLAQAATLQIYTDQSKWEADVKVFASEDFADGILNDGLSSIVSDPGKINAAPGVIQDGKWRDVLWPGANGVVGNSTRITFTQNILSFGGIWDTSPAGHGSQIRLTLLNGDQPILSEIIGHRSGTFWGFVSNTPFSSILLTSGTADDDEDDDNAIKETYNLDNLVYGNGPLPPPTALTQLTSAVPIPASIWLFASGLLGLIGIRRRQTSTRPA